MELVLIFQIFNLIINVVILAYIFTNIIETDKLKKENKNLKNLIALYQEEIRREDLYRRDWVWK